jgi:hypothetical protein
VTTLCQAYPDHDAATRAVAALRQAGVDGDRIRVLAGEAAHDARRESVGAYAGNAAAGAPVGSFAGDVHAVGEPMGDFADTGRPGRVGSFADADRDTVTSFPDAIGRMRITGDHDVAAILVDAGLDRTAAEQDVRALHEGRALVLVLGARADGERVRQVLDGAA